MPDNFTTSEKIEINMDPTLFIFLGTTSGKIGWRLKKLYQQAYGDIPIIKYLWMDIDKNIDQDGRNHFDKLQERVELSGFDPSVVIRNLDNHRHIKAWWPDSAPPAGKLSGGGGSPKQMRLIGRMALFMKFNDNRLGASFYSKLTNALNSLKQIQKLQEADELEFGNFRFITNTNNIRVYVIFSPCGGTGSSIAFDIAYLVRKELSGNSPKVIGMSMAPSVFMQEIKKTSEAQRKKARANAYAWFKEHNHLLENPSWDVQYSDEATVTLDTVPFDYQYVVGIENQAGHRLSSLSDVANMMAQGLFLSTATSLGQQLDTHAANVAQTAERFEEKYCAYSSMAAASLIFPTDRLEAYCATRHSERVLQDGFLAFPKELNLQALAEIILSRNNLSNKELMNFLLDIHRVIYSQEQNLKNATDVASALTIIDNQYYEVQKIIEDKKSQIEKHFKKLSVEKKESLIKECLQVIYQHGLAAAVELNKYLLIEQGEQHVINSLPKVVSLIHKYGVNEAVLKKEKDEFELSKKDIKDLDNDALDKIEMSVSPKKWEKKFQTYKASALKQMRDVVNTQLQLDAQDFAIKLINELQAVLSETQKILETNLNDLRLSAQKISEKADKLINPSNRDIEIYEFSKEIDLDFGDYYRSYAEKISNVTDYSFIPTNINDIEEFNQWVKQKLEVDVINFSRTMFSPFIKETSLLSEIKKISEAKGLDPKEYLETQLNQIIRYVLPFFKYTTDIGVPNPETEKLIGVEDTTNTILPISDDDAEYSLIRTGVKDRIDIAVFQHGLPIHVLEDIAECQKMYELALKISQSGKKPDDPLHILPGVDGNSEDFVPEKDYEKKELFVIGMAFNFIAHTGRNYYLDINKYYKDKKVIPGKGYLLGKSRSSAKENFAKSSDFVKQVEEAVEKTISDMGNAAAIKYLDQVIQDYLEKISAYAHESEKTLSEEYRKEIQIIESYKKSLLS